MGSIPREHMYWQKKCITWMHCKSLWIKASDKCINVIDAFHFVMYLYSTFLSPYLDLYFYWASHSAFWDCILHEGHMWFCFWIWKIIETHVNTFLIVPVRLGHQGEVNASAVGVVLLTFKFPSHLIQNIFLSLSMALLDLHLLTTKTNREKESEQISFEQPQLPQCHWFNFKNY